MITAEDIRKELTESFSSVTFQEEGHKYFFDNEYYPETMSVTGLVGSLHAPFDKEFWSEKKAKKRGVDKSVILEEWDNNAKFSCDKGTAVHRFMECFYSGLKFEIPDGLNNPEIVKAVNVIKPNCKKFIIDYNNTFIPVVSEFKVGIKEWKLCGTIDQIFLDKKTGKIWIYDWKTNKDFTTSNRYGSTLLEPFDYLQDCCLTTYSIQLYLYKKMIEEKTNLKIAGCVLVWLGGNESYKTYPCLNMANECNILVRKRIAELK